MIKNKSTKKNGFTLVEIMIVVGIIALLAAIGIPNLLRAKENSNVALAKATLHTISTAAETYSLTNGGNYPNDEGALTLTVPAYINKSYCGKTISNYAYTCTFNSSGYTAVAAPLSSTSTTYTVSTGGVVTP